MSYARNCLALFSTPTPDSDLTIGQHAAGYATTGISSYALTYGFMHFLHCVVGAESLANNVPFQLCMLMAIDAYNRISRVACHTRDPLALITGEARGREIELSPSRDPQRNIEEIRFTLLMSFSGLVVGMVTALAISSLTTSPTDNSLHMNHVCSAVALLIALGGKFALWDVKASDTLKSYADKISSYMPLTSSQHGYDSEEEVGRHYSPRGSL